MSGAAIIDFDSARIAPWLVRAIEGFLNDPPDSDHQRGYLAALLCVYQEGLGLGKTDERMIVAQRLLQS